MRVMFAARCLAVSFAAATAGLPSAIAAQVVMGQLRSSADRQPLSGAFMVLSDSGGRQHARAMTDQTGRFTLRAPGAGRYRLEAEQIGYQTARSPLFTLGADTLSYPFTIEVKPVQLPSIEVASRERGCERRPDGAEVATLWGEIRKVLAVTTWTERFGGFTYTNHVYRIVVDPDRALMLEEGGSTSSARSRSPFTVTSPADLALRGFSRADSTGVILLGPDATILTAEEFLNGHCFKLAIDQRAPESVGLAFEPMRRQRDVTDIRGTLWVDRESAALRRLEYAYTNLPDPYGRYGAGGEMDFYRLANGQWIVGSWRIRSPSLVMGRDYDNRPGIQRRGIVEDGGVVLRAAEGAEALYAFEGDATVEGTVRNSPAGGPLPGARVILTGTGLSAVTNEQGFYRISKVPAGRYGLAFSHQLTRDLAVPVGLDSVYVGAGGTVQHELALSSLDRIQQTLCSSTLKDDAAPGFIYGFVTDDTGRPIAEAEARADWVASGMAQTTHWRAGERSNENGRYCICRLPIDTPLAVQLRLGNQAKLLPARIPATGLPVVRLDFR